MDMWSASEQRKERTMSNQEQALADFMNKIQESRELLRKIGERLDDHLGVAPEEITWANAGDAGRILADLRDIAAYLEV
jgi:uncharacterized protein YjiS (DUF1127 family)